MKRLSSDDNGVRGEHLLLRVAGRRSKSRSIIRPKRKGWPTLSSDPGERHNWTRAAAEALYQAPFNDLVFMAHTIHRRCFDPNKVQLSRLLSVKTGGCPEDCAYCSQSAHYETGLNASR